MGDEIPPSMKAAAMRGVLTDVQKLVSDGRVSRDVLESSLTEGDRELLRDDVPDSAWVPIDRYERLYRLLARYENPGGGTAYFRARGMATAKRMLGLGVYSQLALVTRTDGAPDMAGILSRMRMTATLWNSVYSFGKFEAVMGDEANVIEFIVRDCDPMPEFAWDAVGGFVERLIQETNTAMSLVWDHRSDGVVTFRVTLGVDRD